MNSAYGNSDFNQAPATPAQQPTPVAPVAPTPVAPTPVQPEVPATPEVPVATEAPVAQTKFCTNCGSQVDINANNCPQCGHTFSN